MKKLFYINFYVIVTFCLTGPTLADTDHGVNLYFKEDYAAALAEFSECAANGDADAQYWLGLMHESGTGVEQDYLEARKWYERAADQGEVGAQLQLAELYFSGHGTEKNYVLAHMWFDIAAKQGLKFASRSRERVALGMIESDIIRARQMAGAWRPRMSGYAAEDAYARAREAMNNPFSLWSLETLFSGD